MIKHMMSVAAMVAAVTIGSTAGHATPFTTGSLAIDLSTNAHGTLNATTIFSLVPIDVHGDLSALASGTGSLSGLDAKNVFGATTAISLGDSGSFNFSDVGIGTFTAKPGPVKIVSDAGNFLLISLIGTFTVGSDFSNVGEELPALEDFAMSQVGGPGTAISISGTFEAPVAIDEPAPVSILGAASIGLLALGARRRRA